MQLDNGTQEGLSSSMDVMQIYHNDAVDFEGLRIRGIIEDEVPRVATSSELDLWRGIVGDAYKIPEDGRLRLVFSKRWLLTLTSSDAAQRHLEHIIFDEESCLRLNGGRTTITDLFDTGQKICYAVGVQESNNEPHNDQYFHATPTSSGRENANHKLLTGPWRRLM